MYAGIILQKKVCACVVIIILIIVETAKIHLFRYIAKYSTYYSYKIKMYLSTLYYLFSKRCVCEIVLCVLADYICQYQKKVILSQDVCVQAPHIGV